MKSQNVTVVCEHGLHLRVASKVSKIVRKSGASVSILCADCPKIDACSVFQLLAMGATAGTSLEIEVEARTEKKASTVLRALTDAFEQGGGI